MALVRITGTDLEVSPICLGSGEIGWSINQDDSFKILDLFVEKGGNFIDTARVYGQGGGSERIIGAWLQSRKPAGVVVATKGAHPSDDNPHRCAPDEIALDINLSLEALRLDCIPLYWIHKDEPSRPVEEIVDTLNAQVQAGNIRYFAAANFTTQRIKTANAYAARQGLMGFAADQFLWNAAVMDGAPFGDPIHGQIDDERFAYHQATGLTAVCYQSQAYGLFNHMFNGTLDSMNKGFRAFYKQPESTQRYERMREIMAQSGLTITQVVLGYLTGQTAFPTIPIIGYENAAQVADSMTAIDVRLTPAQIAYLEEIKW